MTRRAACPGCNGGGRLRACSPTCPVMAAILEQARVSVERAQAARQAARQADDYDRLTAWAPVLILVGLIGLTIVAVLEMTGAIHS